MAPHGILMNAVEFGTCYAATDVVQAGVSQFQQTRGCMQAMKRICRSPRSEDSHGRSGRSHASPWLGKSLETQVIQSAGTARVRAQSRMAAISSERVTL